KTVPDHRPEIQDAENQIPTGPVISVSNGEKAQNRTYKDLLESPIDENNFETLAQAEIRKVTMAGEESLFFAEDMYNWIYFSPNGEYVLVSRLKKPFSYIVPQSRFPYDQIIYDKKGKPVKVFNQVPLTEVLPQGFGATRTGKRNVSWRSDKPAVLYWVEALDEGDPKNKVPYRDAVYQVEAPFDSEGELLLKVKNRYSFILWGNDNTAIAYDHWFADRNTKTYVFDPSDSSKKPFVLFDRNTQDVYGNPGRFVTTYNEYGNSILDLTKGTGYLIGSGFSEKGQFPFVDKINLEDGTTKRLYESTYVDKKESLIRAFDMKKGRVLVRIESNNEYPNYYIRNINTESLRQITHFKNPFDALKKVHKEV